MRLVLRVECAVTARRCASARGSLSGRRSVKTRIGNSRPARRSSAPSSTVTTARESAPASKQARATSTEPWPYASALTTAIRREFGALRLRVPTLWRTALRSTSAQVRLGILTPAAVLLTVVLTGGGSVRGGSGYPCG